MHLCMVLKTHRSRESDLVVEGFCENLGKVRLYAAHAQKRVQRFPGGLEPFKIYHWLWEQGRSQQLPYLTYSEVVRDFKNIVQSVYRMAFGSCALDLIRSFVQEGQGDLNLWQDLWRYLEILQILPEDPIHLMSLSLRWFELKVFWEYGIIPHALLKARGELEKPWSQADPQTLAAVRKMFELSIEKMLKNAWQKMRLDQGEQLEKFLRESGALHQAMMRQILSAPLSSYQFMSRILTQE